MKPGVYKSATERSCIYHLHRHDEEVVHRLESPALFPFYASDSQEDKTGGREIQAIRLRHPERQKCVGEIGGEESNTDVAIYTKVPYMATTHIADRDPGIC